jgi:hypothetical protein
MRGCNDEACDIRLLTSVSLNVSLGFVGLQSVRHDNKGKARERERGTHEE